MNVSRQFCLGIASALLVLVRAAAGADAPQYYELRDYSTSSTNQQQAINDYWQNVGVPAYNRLGAQPIGVFTAEQASATNHVYVLIPYDSAAAFAAAPAALAADPVYQAAAAPYMEVGKTNASYLRFDTSLLVAFDGMKKLELPASSAEKKPWVFELRCYQSQSEGKGINKVDMFDSGEITLMKEVGLSPVFYGRTIAGTLMPNLIYMLSGENRAEHEKHWQAFRTAPIWAALQRDPKFKDNVSLVMPSRFLVRMPASQI